MKYKIYYLTSSKDNYNPVYIGITTKPLNRRLGGHKSDSKKGNSKVHNWIKNRISNGFEVIINLIDEVESDGFFWEDFYIDLMKTWGFSLKNTLYSGYSELNVGKRGEMSLEAKIKLSKLYKNKKLSPERIKLSVDRRLEIAKKRGYYHSNETKAKLSKILTGKQISESEKQRLRTIKIGSISDKRIPILALNLITHKIEYFNFILEAEDKLLIPHGNIIKVLNGDRKSAGKHYFCKLGCTCPIKIG